MNAKKEVDYLFVIPHDGIEYIDVLLPETIARYRDFIDYGADAVVASHPHCPQGWEEYNVHPIFYSLGNFFFNSKEDPSYRAWNRPHWYEGRRVIISLDRDKLSYEVINTRNKDNIAIEIDHSEASIKHNESICNYLKDRKSYNEYLTPYLKNQATADIRRIKATFQPYLLKRLLRV